MLNMLRLSEAAAIGLHATALLAADSDGFLSAKSMADTLQVSEAHLSKVLQRLVKAGIAKSVRGPKGGFTLAKPSRKISLLDVYESIDGPLALGDCILGNHVCKRDKCIMGGLVKMVNSQVKEYMSGTLLDSLGETNGK